MQITFDPDNRVEVDRVWNMIQCLYPDLYQHPIPEINAMVRKVKHPKPKTDPLDAVEVAAGLRPKIHRPCTQHSMTRTCHWCQHPFQCDHSRGKAVCPACKVLHGKPAPPVPKKEPEIQKPLPPEFDPPAKVSKTVDITAIKTKIDAGELGQTVPTEDVTKQTNEALIQHVILPKKTDRGDAFE